MAELHPLVLQAQRLAKGRRQHPSNAAFGHWVRDNGFGHLTHRDRGALLRIAQLDPQEASDHISRSRYTTPEHLWYRVLSRLAVRKTALVLVRKTEPEVEYAKRVEEFLERLRLADGEDDPEDWYLFFDEHVCVIAAIVDHTCSDPLGVFKHWLEDQKLFALGDDDRDFLLGLIEHRDTWEGVVYSRMRKT